MTKPIGIRMSLELIEKLNKLAKKENRTFSNLVVTLLTQIVDKMEDEK